MNLLPLLTAEDQGHHHLIEQLFFYDVIASLCTQLGSNKNPQTIVVVLRILEKVLQTLWMSEGGIMSNQRLLHAALKQLENYSGLERIQQLSDIHQQSPQIQEASLAILDFFYFVSNNVRNIFVI